MVFLLRGGRADSGRRGGGLVPGSGRCALARRGATCRSRDLLDFRLLARDRGHGDLQSMGRPIRVHLAGLPLRGPSGGDQHDCLGPSMSAIAASSVVVAGGGRLFPGRLSGLLPCLPAAEPGNRMGVSDGILALLAACSSDGVPSSTGASAGCGPGLRMAVVHTFLLGGGSGSALEGGDGVNDGQDLELKGIARMPVVRNDSAVIIASG